MLGKGSTKKLVSSLFTLLFLSFGTSSVRADLLLFYTFDDDSDPLLAIDETGQGNDGIISGNDLDGDNVPDTPALYTDAGLGRTGAGDDRALDFLTTADGTYITVPTATAGAFDSMTTNDAATITMWILGHENQPVNQWNFWFGPNRQLGSHVPWSDGTIYFDVAGCCTGAQRIQKSEPDPSKYKGEWNHYAFVKEVDTTRIYQNGVLWHEGTGKSPLGFITEVFFGAGDSNHTSNYNGLIDEIGVWDEALTEEAIQDVMESGVGPPKPISIRRSIPDTLINGTSGVVTISVLVRIPGSVVVINEKMLPGLTAANPSNGGVLAGDTITWNLGTVNTQIDLTYTMTASPDAVNEKFLSTATVDGQAVGIGGDTSYTGSSFTTKGFIRLWNHLGPLAWAYPVGAGDHGDTILPGACSTLEPDPADPTINVASLSRDWIVNADGSLNETNIIPFPGMLVRPNYGGNGVVPGGTGARAAGLTVEALDTGKVVRDRFPVWKSSLAQGDTIDHASSLVHGFDADDHLTMSCVYVTNHTDEPISTMVGAGSDDSIQVLINDVDISAGDQGIVCRGWGAANEEQSQFPATLEVGENRVLVKISDGYGSSGFRLRFHDPDSPDPFAPDGLLPPRITVSLESSKNTRPANIVRTLAKATYSQGEKVGVTLAATATKASDLVILEQIPAGATASAISDGGSQTGDVIRWSFTSLTQKTVSYQVSLSGCTGDANFGQCSVKVGVNEVEGTGASTLTRVYNESDLTPWDSRDIGLAVGAPPGSSEKLGAHEALVRGTGAGIKLTKDSFRYVSVPLSGDFEFTARIGCFNDPSGSGLSQAGIMVRESTAEGAVNAFVGIAPSLTGTSLATMKGSMRTTTDKNTSLLLATGSPRDVPSLPIYLKIIRSGTNLTFQRSPDGVTYTDMAAKVIGTATGQLQFGADVLLGLAVTGTGTGEMLADFQAVSGPEFPAEQPAPNPPQGLNATAGDQKVNLSWNAPAAGGGTFTGYSISRDGTKIADVPSDERTYTDQGLTNGTQYCYKVQATRGPVKSTDSNQSCATPKVGTGPTFKRGDVDLNGSVEITDAVNLLGYLFQGADKPGCLEAADIEDSGEEPDITDAVNILGYLFLGASAPPNPGPDVCGQDPTPDALGCTKSCGA